MQFGGQGGEGAEAAQEARAQEQHEGCRGLPVASEGREQAEAEAGGQVDHQGAPVAMGQHRLQPVDQQEPQPGTRHGAEGNQEGVAQQPPRSAGHQPGAAHAG